MFLLHGIALSIHEQQRSDFHRQISMWTASRIAGTVLRKDGSPAPHVTVEFSRYQNGRLQWPKESVSDKDGRFEFRTLPPGIYVLGVNVLQGATFEIPYVSRYYPDATSIDSAEKIEIDGPVQFDNLRFRLGERLPTRDVEVLLTWWDGSPVINAAVNFALEGTPDNAAESFSRYSDERGMIRCSVFTGRRLSVIAGRLHWQTESDPLLDRTPVTVEPGDTPIRLQFVISKANDKRETLKPSLMSRFDRPCL